MALFGWPDPVQRAIEALRGELAGGPEAHLSPEVQELANLLTTRVERRAILGTQHDVVQQLLDAIPDAAGIFEANGRVRMANRAFLDLRGGGRASGHTALEATRSAELGEAVARALQGTSGQVELTLPAAGLTVRAYVSPLGGGEALLLLRDLTAAKRLEVARRDFVANASHELRTPVSAIAAAAETLQDAVKLPEGAAPFLQVIVRHAERLRRLTDVLLDLSRVESGEWQLERAALPLKALVAQAIDLVRERAEEKKLNVTSSIGPDLAALGDRRALEQVLVNLLDNAVKYSGRGGAVQISAEQQGAHVVLSIADTGAGIEPRHVGRLFERFYRADPGRARGEGGTGLGLAIVKHLVQAQKGEVGVESGAGGSRFWVKLEAAGS